jgi:hypothetical protein
MLKSVIAAGAVLSVFTPLATSVAAVPLLSGKYLYTNDEFCQLGVTVQYGSAGAAGTVVKSVAANGGATVSKLGGGILSFAQSGTAGTGTAGINGLEAGGSSVVLTETGGGITGTGGAPITIKTEVGSASFTQTTTQLSLVTKDGTQTYNIYYGKTVSGVVQYAIAIGLETKGCAQRYVLTHQ